MSDRSINSELVLLVPACTWGAWQGGVYTGTYTRVGTGQGIPGWVYLPSRTQGGSLPGRIPISPKEAGTARQQ